MRDSNNNNFQIVVSIENFLTEEAHNRIGILRNHVADNPNFLSENYMVLPYKLRSIQGLVILSWWISEEIGVILREDIRDKRLKRFNLEDQFLIETFLMGKNKTIQVLNDSSLWHSRDFFGNILYEGNRCLERLRFRKNRTKVIYPKRKRGYDDHGSRVPDSKWLPKYDYSLTELQNEIEAERKSQEDTLDFLKGFLE